MTLSPSRFVVPAIDAEPWPTLGPEVCDWIEEHLVHGPGDVLGRPVTLTPEERLFIYRAYEVYPRKHEHETRRRFKRCVLSRRKGTAKTELAAMIALAELDPRAPVRCDGWRVERGEWVPVGRSVRDPYIPMVAVTEEQSAELAFGSAYAILQECPLGNDYVIGLDRIYHRDEPGKMQALASAPSARDGARTTFEHFDETHLFTSTRLRESHAMMLRNLPKRYQADPWALETTTMYAPGEESVAEDSHRYAEAIAAGLIDDPRLLFDHRQASESHDIDTKRGLLFAIEEASGDAIAWTDVESVVSQFRDPTTDKNQLRRFWLNQRRRNARRWMPDGAWEARADHRRIVEDKTRIVLAFDGSYNRDSTALVGCTIEETPHVFVVAAWERPPADPNWRVSRSEVEDAIDAAMERYEVVELAPDPPGWHREIEDWELKYDDVVVRFETNQASRMGPACDGFNQAVRSDGEMTHDGDQRLSRHIANCVTRERGPHTVVTKERTDSPQKIDIAVAAIVAYDRARWRYVNDNDSSEPLFAFA